MLRQTVRYLNEKKRVITRLEHYVPAVQHFAARLVFFQEAAARGIGLTATKLKCFRLVQAGKATMAAELVGDTGVTAASVSAVVDRLVEKDFPRRQQEPADRRFWLLTVRPGSIERARAVYGAHGEQVEPVLAKYDGADFKFLLTFFDDFGTAMKESAIEMAAERSTA